MPLPSPDLFKFRSLWPSFWEGPTYIQNATHGRFGFVRIKIVLLFFQWDIVCDNEWLKPLADSLFMLGDLPGAVILGALSDRFGRKRTLMWGSIVQLFLGLLLTVAPNFYAYILLRLLLGVCSGLFLTAYVTCKNPTSLFELDSILHHKRRPTGLYTEFQL